MAEHDFTVSAYLREKQHSLLDALEENELKPRRQRKESKFSFCIVIA